MTGSAGAEPPQSQPPRSFQGWQRGACLIGVGLLVLLTLVLVVTAGLGALGIN
ncbi:MAG: hypothetical protein WCB86_06110 [Candidatus Dormiibacterota bacterium]